MRFSRDLELHGGMSAPTSKCSGEMGGERERLRGRTAQDLHKEAGMECAVESGGPYKSLPIANSMR